MEAQRTLDKATADFNRLTELQQARTAAWQSSSRALANVENWLRQGVPDNCTLDAVEVEVPKLAKGENGLLDQIENRRRRVRELKADLHRIQSAPFPSSYAKQRLREMVEQFAARGAPDLTNLIEHDGDIIWPTLRVQSVVHDAQRSLAFHEAVDVVGLFACLLKPTLISVLDAFADEASDDPAALTHEARQQREAKVMGDLLAVERDESALVWRAMDEKLPVDHRADISPLALLGVALVTAPRATNGHASTSPLAYDVSYGGR